MGKIKPKTFRELVAGDTIHFISIKEETLVTRSVKEASVYGNSVCIIVGKEEMYLGEKVVDKTNCEITYYLRSDKCILGTSNAAVMEGMIAHLNKKIDVQKEKLRKWEEKLHTERQK